MVDNESLPKVFDLINQMNSNGKEISNQRVVKKLLISMPKSYDSITSVIENTKDLEVIDAQDVISILKGYEQRLNRYNESSTEKAFTSIDISSRQTNKFGGQVGNIIFHKGFKNKGKQWSNRVNNLVKPWRGNNSAKIPL